MDHFAGLDVSVKETSVCIVDDTGKIVREVRWRANLKRCWRF
jgi:predicted NBD/HSP70 family sugar kinase